MQSPDPVVTVRAYQPRDHASVVDLIMAGFWENDALDPDRKDLAAGKFERYYEEPDGRFWVAEADSIVVGTVGVKKTGTDTFQLKRMAVHRSWRRRGIARLLYRAAAGWLIERGAKRVVLSTTVQQAPALELYRSLGFTEVGTRRVGPFTVIDLERWLAP